MERARRPGEVPEEIRAICRVLVSRKVLWKRAQGRGESVRSNGGLAPKRCEEKVANRSAGVGLTGGSAKTKKSGKGRSATTAIDATMISQKTTRHSGRGDALVGM